MGGRGVALDVEGHELSSRSLLDFRLQSAPADEVLVEIDEAIESWTRLG